MTGITVCVCGESGEQLTTPIWVDQGDDPIHWVSALIPPVSDRGSACWRFIDPYGLTTFNRLQLATFVEEIDRRSANATSRQLGKLEEIRALADFALALPHRYLRFAGD